MAIFIVLAAGWSAENGEKLAHIAEALELADEIDDSLHRVGR
jgi:hypothetical protein